MSARVVHFEITADDLARAASFYRDVLGWDVAAWEGEMPYLLASTGEGPGIDGALMPRDHDQAVIVTAQVDQPLEQVLARVIAAGGALIGEIGDIPGVGRHAYVRDSEGNVVGLLQPTP